MDFFDSPSCKKQLVCRDCRSIVDPTIRHQIAAKHGLDPEFECPTGFPMGSEMLPVTVAGRVPERIARAVVVKKERPAPRSRTAPPAIPSAVPRDQWPMTLRILARLAADGEKGVGDTIKRQLSIGGKNAIEWVMKALNIPCGCDNRRAWLNTKYPYSPLSSDPV